MTNVPEIPVLLYREGMDLPKAGTYFVVAGNGIFMHKDHALIRCFTKVDQIGVLSNLEQDLQLESKIPKVPVKHIVKIKEFFRRVVELHHSEACAKLYYKADINDWKIEVSRQRANHSRVEYDKNFNTTTKGSEFENYLCVGTIHSHCDFGAFHSGVDIHDEEEFDGIHGTFGNNDKDEFTVSASIVINGARTKVDPMAMFEGLTEVNALREVYKLSVPKEHREMMEQGVEEWLAKVNAHDIVEGDLVTWKGPAGPLRAVYGNGPFKVESITEGMLTLEGQSSSFVLASQMFRRV